jgi:hypothetical protein
VTITTDTPEIIKGALEANAAAVAAALSSNSDALSRSLASSDKSLAALADTRIDPNVKTNSDALNAVAIVAVAFAALQLFARRRAA